MPVKLDVGFRYGKNKQLLVVAVDGKICEVVCDICHQDVELFPKPLKVSKLTIYNRKISCACCKSYRWTHEQNCIRAKRYCLEKDLIYISLSEKRLLAGFCKQHGEFSNVQFDRLLSDYYSPCKLCRKNKIAATTKETRKRFTPGTWSEEKHLQELQKSKVNKDYYDFKIIRGLRAFEFKCKTCSFDEYVLGGLCSGIFSCQYESLKFGTISCRCGKNYLWTENQRKYQINKRIEDEGLNYKFIGWVQSIGYENHKSRFIYNCSTHGNLTTTVQNFLIGKNKCGKCFGKNFNTFYLHKIYIKGSLVGFKFGITSNYKNRLSRLQNTNKKYCRIKPYKVLTNLSSGLCAEIEKMIQTQVECNVISKKFMPDGYTETFHHKNLPKVLGILEKSDS